MSSVGFRISVKAGPQDASLYFENMPPMSVPRAGEDMFVPGDGHGWWRVVEVWWMLPAMGAMTPTMEASLVVEWSPINNRPAPTYDEDTGWAQTSAESPSVSEDV